MTDPLRAVWRVAVPARARYLVSEARRRRAKPEDLVSVIVPIYNVEHYLRDCLTSVVEQTHEALQIIVVDDGSPDGSRTIAEEFARVDSRIKIVSQPNRGLGAARNFGLRHAQGNYVCFVDSDDTLPVTGIAAMVASLRTTGSDFAVGTARRFTSRRRWIPQWATEVHAIDRPGIRLVDYPEILKDVFAWNKLFRAAFFRSVVQGFPEGILYEDQEPTARAYVAGQFDVLKAVVYEWREREDGSSITQQKANLKDLADRLQVKESVANVMSAAPVSVRRSWQAKAIGFDLRPYYEQVPRTGDDFWQRLHAGVTELLSAVDEESWRLVSMIDRLQTLAVAAGERDDVTTLLIRRQEYTWRLPGVVEDGRPMLHPRYLEGLKTPLSDARRELAPTDVRLLSRLTGHEWVGTTLQIHGYAYLQGLDLAEANSRITLTAVSARSNQTRLLQVTRDTSTRLDHISGDAWNSYAPSVFSARLITDDLLVDGETPESWRFQVQVEVGGFSRTAGLSEREDGGATVRQPVGPLQEHGRWTIAFDDVGLKLSHEPRSEMLVVDLAIDGRDVRFTLAGPPPTALLLECRSLGHTFRIPGRETNNGSYFAFTLPAIQDPGLQLQRHVWQLRGEVDARRVRIAWPGSTTELRVLSPPHLRVRALCSRLGTFRLEQSSWFAAIDKVSCSRRGVHVAGRIDADPDASYRARFANQGLTTRSVKLKVNSSTSTFDVRIPLQDRSDQPISVGGMSFRIATRVDGRTVERWIPVSEELELQLPLDQNGELFAATFSRTRDAAALWMRLRQPYEPDERGRLAQRILHRSVHSNPPQPEDAVLFESFNGKSVSDSVLALFHELRRRELGGTLYWSVRDRTTPVPEGAIPLLMHSRRWNEVLHSARHLVNNNNFPFYFRKQPGQTYVQTWHGTPLKRIGNDVPAANLSLSYRQLMVREAQTWDVLLAQNAFAGEVLPRAFGYQGEVVQVGYPRNDALVDHDAAERRRRIRTALGYADDARVVLYAPTWRDNVTAGRQYAFINYLDFEKAEAALGEGTQFLLRGHVNTASNKDGLPSYVRDVSTYPDINDLMLAADLLITDYSSVMFDFCATGRPIFFLTPDIELYRSTTRGFYFDLEARSPGPLCRSNDELAAELARVTGYADRWNGRYTAFASAFGPDDDGMAARRVVEAVWGSVGVNTAN